MQQSPLGNNLEKLTLTGNADLTGTGNSLNNVITGNSGNNTLDGGDGYDTLVGGFGSDTYVVDNIDDVIIELNSNSILRVSTDVNGNEGNNYSDIPVFSPDGTKIAFVSRASNLVDGDNNDNNDVFLKDLQTGVVTRVSLDSNGVEGNDSSLLPVFSPDGTKIAFISGANNLVSGDTNNAFDIFVKDLETGLVTRINTDSSGLQANYQSTTPVFSPDGTKIVFTSNANNLVANDTNNTWDVFLKDLTTGNLTRISTDSAEGQGNYQSGEAAFSPDGTKVMFVSGASNLVPNDANGYYGDIFIKDLTTGMVSLVSKDANNIQGNNWSGFYPLFSSDGSKIFFTSDASNLVLNDTNGTYDIFAKDLTTGVVTRINTDSFGAQANEYSHISDYGSILSPYGTKVVFFSMASNLVPNDVNNATDVFIKDLTSGIVTIISRDSNGLYGNANSQNPVFSPDGTKIVFSSSASNLVSGDTNNARDIFIRDLTLEDSGIDTVQASISYTLGDNLENLTLTGTADITGTGNSLDNVITGNSGNNVLSGGLGNDYLNGGTGTDNAVYLGSWRDYLITGNSTTATVTGTEGTDTLNDIELISFFGTSGGAYFTIAQAANSNPIGVDDNNASDAVVEVGLFTTGDATATGNVLNNDTDANIALGDEVSVSAVLGNSANVGTAVTGVYGSVVINANGSYSYTLDNNDVDTEALETGQTVTDSFTYTVSDFHGLTGTATLNITISGSTDRVSVSSSTSSTLVAGQTDLVLTGSSNISGTGNNFNNSITGNVGNNVLNGGAGIDTLIGGLGNDGYYVDNTSEVVTELLNEGTDTVYSTAANYTLSANIENLTLLSGALNGTGNSEANSFTGNGANNIINALDGNDTLNGGAGADTLIGGLGNDSYFVDNLNDVVTELATEGTDWVYSEIDYTLNTNIEHLVQLGSNHLTATGNALNNDMMGNSGNNYLVGLAGNDTLNGGAGVDTLEGGLGDDVYYVDNLGDVVTELASEGIDTIYSTIGYSLGSELEHLNFIGSSAINGTGSALNNQLIGNNGNNLLAGLAGNDTLNGGLGIDTLVGGLGDDVYYVDNISDVVTELAVEGTDLVYTTVNYTLSANVESLTLLGATNIRGIGNADNNLLTGNTGSNTLDGGLGADTLLGGQGSDTYIVDNIGDVVTELASQGIDSVNTSISYSLGANVENITLTGSVGIAATGNELNNTLTGNSGANTLTGGLGNDSLFGGIGNDRYNFARGDGQDIITENDATAGNTDVLSFTTSVNRDQLWFKRVSNHLEVSVIGTTDKMTINNWYLHSNYRVEMIQASDGGSLSSLQVQQLVSAMASMTAPSLGQTTLTTEQRAILDPVIAVSWV